MILLVQVLDNNIDYYDRSYVYAICPSALVNSVFYTLESSVLHYRLLLDGTVAFEILL